jgi:hypothetical protein
MPNILKRPMFRKGGSTADGVGITSGLSTRQNYAEAGVAKNLEYDEEKGYSIKELQDAGLFRTGGKETTPQTTTNNTQTSYDPLSDPSFDIIRNRYQELLPTKETSLQDLVTALGATAPEDATKLQTIGQVLSKAGTTATGLRQQREATAEGFKSAALTEVLKNMNAEDKDQLIRRAKIFARLNNIPEDQAVNLFLSKLLETGGSEYLKDYSPIAKAKQYGDQLVAGGYIDEGDISPQLNAGNIWYLYETNQLPKEVMEKNLKTARNGDIVIDSENETVLLNEKAYESEYVPNTAYVNPADGGIYLYEGNGQFKKIYP